MAEERKRLISEEKGDVSKPNFDAEDLKKMVEENAELKKLKKFIKGNSVAVKTKKSIAIKDKGKDKEKTKDKEIRIDINEFNEFDYLNFALIITAIDDGGITQGHCRGQSLIPSSKSIKETDKQNLLKILFNKFSNTYNFKDINSYIYEKAGNESDIKAKEELNKIHSPIKLLTLLEIIDRFNMGFGWSKTDFKNFIGLRVITNFNKTYFNNIEENFKIRFLNLMIQILKDCLSNVHKLEKEEFLDFLEFIIDNFDFINNSDYIEHFSDIHNLTSSIFNYFLNVNDCNDEFTKNFVKKLKEILLKIKEPKINFSDILSRLNGCKEDVDKVKFILPFLIYMNILSLDENKKNYIIDLLIKDGNIIYLKSIYEKCCEIEIEQIKDQRYKEFYEKEFNKFKKNIIEKYVEDIIDFINYTFIFNFSNDLDGLCKVLENFWNPKRSVEKNEMLCDTINKYGKIFLDFIKYIYSIDNSNTAELSFDGLSDIYKINIKLIKQNNFTRSSANAIKFRIEKSKKNIKKVYKILNINCNTKNSEDEIKELKKENEELKKIKEEYERLKQENERLKQENEELKKAKKEENVFTSSSICGPSSGRISVESNAVMSQNVMGKTRDEGKIPSFQETATQTKKCISSTKVRALIKQFESKENQNKNEGEASLTRSSTLKKYSGNGL